MQVLRNDKAAFWEGCCGDDFVEENEEPLADDPVLEE